MVKIVIIIITKGFDFNLGIIIFHYMFIIKFIPTIIHIILYKTKIMTLFTFTSMNNYCFQIIDNILLTLNISGKHYKNIYKYLDNFLSSLNNGEYYTELDWLNQIIASVTTGELKTVIYGNLFAIRKGNKIEN